MSADEKGDGAKEMWGFLLLFWFRKQVCFHKLERQYHSYYRTNYDTLTMFWTDGILKRKKKKVPQPNLYSSYSRSMGGVDLHDEMVNNYRIGIHAKKWWWPLLIHPDEQHDHSQRMEDLRTSWRFAAGLTVIHPHNSKALPVPWCTLQKHQEGPLVHCACYCSRSAWTFPQEAWKTVEVHSHKRSKWCCKKCKVTLCIKHGCFNKFHAPRKLWHWFSKSLVCLLFLHQTCALLWQEPSVLSRVQYCTFRRNKPNSMKLCRYCCLLYLTKCKISIKSNNYFSRGPSCVEGLSGITSAKAVDAALQRGLQCFCSAFFT